MRGLVVTVLVLGLLGASVAAFATTEALKLEKSPVGGSRFDLQFSPTCACQQETARLRVRIRRTDSVDATVLDLDGNEVRNLAENREHERGFLRLAWDGRDDAGRIVPDGRYRLRIHLDRDRRTVVIPKKIQVDTEPPAVRLERAFRDVFSPDGDGRRDRAGLLYSASESARALLFVDGEQIEESEVRYRSRAAVVWDGRLGGEVARPGVYALSVRVRDTAGNLSEPTDAVLVRVRFIEVDVNRTRIRAGKVLRFRVDTDAKDFRWGLDPLFSPSRFAAKSASGRVVSARVPRRLQPGLYAVVVSVNGHSDRELVRILRPRPRR